jgi:nitroreductase
MENKTIKAIKQRYSTRTFSKKPIPEKMIGQIQDFLTNPGQPPFGSKTRFKLIPTKFTGIKDAERVGTYGFIKGAMYFIAGSVKKSRNSFEDFGFILEKIIIRMTELGLGTCWLGGTFNRKDFYRILDCSEGEMIPAVTPIGYSEDKKGFRDVVMRALARSDKRLDWEKLFFKDGIPLKEKEAGEFREALEMVRIAPSSSNNQPWRIFMDRGLVHFYIKAKASKNNGFLKDVFKRIDIGIAMYHFEAALRAKDIKGEWVIGENLNMQDLKYVASWKRHIDKQERPVEKT